MAYKPNDDLTVQDLVDFGIPIWVATQFIQGWQPGGSEPKIEVVPNVDGPHFYFYDRFGGRWILKADWVVGNDDESDTTDASAWM